MTECFPSPPPFSRLSHKRLSSSSFYAENISEISLSRNPFKRQRNHDMDQLQVSSNECTSTYMNNSGCLKKNRTLQDREHNDTSCPIISASVRVADFDQNPNNTIDENREEIYRCALRAEFQTLNDRKDSEILSLRASVQHQEIILFQTQAAKVVCEEENRILKRAVAIQDGRQKELVVQSQQLQNVLGQAAEHIANLESVNRELRIQLESNRGQYSFHSFDRPPDVF